MRRNREPSAHSHPSTPAHPGHRQPPTNSSKASTRASSTGPHPQTSNPPTRPRPSASRIPTRQPHSSARPTSSSHTPPLAHPSHSRGRHHRYDRPTSTHALSEESDDCSSSSGDESTLSSHGYTSTLHSSLHSQAAGVDMESTGVQTSTHQEMVDASVGMSTTRLASTHVHSLVMSVYAFIHSSIRGAVARAFYRLKLHSLHTTAADQVRVSERCIAIYG